MADRAAEEVERLWQVDAQHSDGRIDTRRVRAVRYWQALAAAKQERGWTADLRVTAEVVMPS